MVTEMYRCFILKWFSIPALATVYTFEPWQLSRMRMCRFGVPVLEGGCFFFFFFFTDISVVIRTGRSPACFPSWNPRIVYLHESFLELIDVHTDIVPIMTVSAHGRFVDVLLFFLLRGVFHSSDSWEEDTQ